MPASGTTGNWREVGPQTFVLATDTCLLNVGLVIGTERAVVIDTGAGPRHAGGILEAVRDRTDLPLTVVNTHAHFDHWFGNAVFASAGVTEFWAHEACARQIEATGDRQRPLVAEAEPEMAANDGPDTAAVVPAHRVAHRTVALDLGDRQVQLFHLGRGHTDHDLLVGADAAVFAGDLVEEGADPAFEDSYPAEWVATLERLIRLHSIYDVFIPGHGKPVEVDFVRVQARTMSRAIRIATRAKREAPSDATKAIPVMPYAPNQARALLGRL